MLSISKFSFLDIPMVIFAIIFLLYIVKANLKKITDLIKVQNRILVLTHRHKLFWIKQKSFIFLYIKLYDSKFKIYSIIYKFIIYINKAITRGKIASLIICL